QRRMWVGVAAGVRPEPVARTLHRVGRLAVARNAVIFGVTADRRARTIVPDGAEGRRHAGRALLDREAFGRQKIDIEIGRAVLAPGGLAEVPDGASPGRPVRPVALDPGKGRRLGVRHCILLAAEPRCRLLILESNLTKSEK